MPAPSVGGAARFLPGFAGFGVFKGNSARRRGCRRRDDRSARRGDGWLVPLPTQPRTPTLSLGFLSPRRKLTDFFCS